MGEDDEEMKRWMMRMRKERDADEGDDEHLI